VAPAARAPAISPRAGRACGVVDQNLVSSRHPSDMRQSSGASTAGCAGPEDDGLTGSGWPTGEKSVIAGPGYGRPLTCSSLTLPGVGGDSARSTAGLRAAAECDAEAPAANVREPAGHGLMFGGRQDPRFVPAVTADTARRSGAHQAAARPGIDDTVDSPGETRATSGPSGAGRSSRVRGSRVPGDASRARVPCCLCALGSQHATASPRQ
jgi:hypothetical protein